MQKWQVHPIGQQANDAKSYTHEEIGYLEWILPINACEVGYKAPHGMTLEKIFFSFCTVLLN